MRNLALLSVLPLVAACATAGTAGPATEGPGECRLDAVQYAVGQPYTVELGAALQDKSGARSLRAISPGQAVTMDFRSDRLNIEIDAQGKVVRVSCG